MKNKSIPISEKKTVYNTCILPCLTYGCQTWPLTQKIEHKLGVCQRRMERSMLGLRLKDKWKATTIRSITKVADVKVKTRTLKWKWTGHMMRSETGKWTKKVTEWYPRDRKRRRGRQKKRWEDDLPKGWRRTATDRQKWRELEEAYVARQPDLVTDIKC
ncbi:unnamed protein product [Euphydryas editha]|uniref:Endonuclease-reverse transcriptase n=1 Tax=Euphydryas editha TaxID=104508 RepID=A0AAU9VDN7_EUPED|nr:unnamed protein product [Euphydryas editha]